jgi:hypothetical protein
VFEDRLVSRGLWRARSPDLIPCDFCLWGNLKDEVYSNNLHTLVNLSKAFMKQFCLSRSMNWNWCQYFQETFSVFKSRMETLRASTVIVSPLNNAFTFRNAHTCYNARHIKREAAVIFLGRLRGRFARTSRRQKSVECVIRETPGRNQLFVALEFYGVPEKIIRLIKITLNDNTKYS